MNEKYEASFDTMPDQYGKVLDGMFYGLDVGAIKELVKLVRTELAAVGSKIEKTPDMSQVLKMMDIFFQRLAASEDLKKGGLKMLLPKLVFKAIDMVVEASDPAFAKEYSIQLTNALETHDAVAAAKVFVRIVSSSAYVREEKDFGLSAKVGKLLADSFESSSIADLITRKGEVKQLGNWTMSEELALQSANGIQIPQPIGEKIIKVYIQTEPPELAGVYEQVAVDKAVGAERQTACPQCGGVASKNPYRQTCENCGTRYDQETLTRVISERVHKLKRKAEPPRVDEAPVRSEPTPQKKTEVKSGTDFEVDDISDLEVSAGPYRNITISNGSEITFNHTRATGDVDISGVSDIDGDLTVSSDSNIAIDDANDCNFSITRVTESDTAATGNLSITDVGEVNLSSTHNEISIDNAGAVYFDNAIAFGDVTIKDAGKISGKLLFIGNGQLRVTDCGQQKLEVRHQ